MGAWFTHEFAVEAAALFNPSAVVHPDQSGLPPGSCRFILSLRAVGEGHLSSVEFRTGVLGPAGELRIDDPGPHIEAGHTSGTSYDREVFAAATRRDGHRSRVRRVRHRQAAPPLPSRRARRGPRDRSPTSGSPGRPPRVPLSWHGASPSAATRSSSRRRPRSPNGCCGRRARRSPAASRTPASCASRTRVSTGRPTRRSTACRSHRSSSRPTTSGISGCPSSPGPPPRTREWPCSHVG